jgi:uncharacterized protein GlcG (DUF336 family)
MRTKQCLTAEDAAKIAAACQAEAAKNKWNVSIVVVDDGGHLLLAHRHDGAPLESAKVALGKARASAFLRRPSLSVEEMVKARPSFAGLATTLDVVGVQGAVPILHQGECVGAIGVSGVQSFEDEQIAKAGLAVIG